MKQIIKIGIGILILISSAFFITAANHQDETIPLPINESLYCGDNLCSIGEEKTCKQDCFTNMNKVLVYQPTLLHNQTCLTDKPMQRWECQYLIMINDTGIIKNLTEKKLCWFDMDLRECKTRFVKEITDEHTLPTPKPVLGEIDIK